MMTSCPSRKSSCNRSSSALYTFAVTVFASISIFARIKALVALGVNLLGNWLLDETGLTTCVDEGAAIVRVYADCPGKRSVLI